MATRILVGVVLSILIGAAPVAVASPSVAVRINDDPGDTFPPGSTNTLYVWLVLYDHAADGLDFGLEGTHTVLSVTPAPGWTNSGTLTSPLLTTDVTGLIYVGPVAAVEVAGELSGDSLCFVESELSGRLCFRHWETGEWHWLDHMGHGPTGEVPCQGSSASAGCSPN